jgi:2-desacetyl-2-hydroxyethyl bacteriochlorophyllide A dehydrogenase
MVRVQSHCSAISAGTELLVYRGQMPADIALDTSLSALQGKMVYPVQYGYACVGVVEAIGAEAEAHWLGRRVFAFAPHASHFIAAPAELIPLPDDIDVESAVFLANMETAVNLVQDGNPGLGERVVVLGQGIVGLLLASLLLQFPLTQLVTVDGLSPRRVRSRQLGVKQVFDPAAAVEMQALKQLLLSADANGGADLIYEVSGAPEALNLGIDLSGFSSRIVIGSWYGSKAVNVALGGAAHRNRLQITTSQVSTIAPALSGRWDKSRRFDLSWEMLRQVQPRQFISHRIPFADAAAAYELLHHAPADIMQAIFMYD